MKLSTKSRYAVLAMLDLAYYGQKELPTSLSEISNRQDISLSYLEQLFSMLKKNNLVGSLEGPGGGYFLAKDSNTIYTSEIIDAVEEKMETTSCNGKANCNNSQQCLSHKLWEDLGSHIRNFLSGVTLSEVIESNDKSFIKFKEYA